MIHCKYCIHWIDEPLREIESGRSAHPHIFMGCRKLGPIADPAAMQSCPHFAQSDNLYTLCHSCNVAVPKVCVSLGECINCTDTDLFCTESCIGGESRKYCTHFVRLHTQGMQLIDDNNQVFDLFPALDMPERKKTS